VMPSLGFACGLTPAYEARSRDRIGVGVSRRLAVSAKPNPSAQAPSFNNSAPSATWSPGA
jgi:hypothetical protein